MNKQKSQTKQENPPENVQAMSRSEHATMHEYSNRRVKACGADVPIPAPEKAPVQTLIIRHKFPTLNDYIRSARGNFYSNNCLKRTLDSIIAWECKVQRIRPVSRAFIWFTWTEKNRQRDKDNIAFAKKFVLDGLQTAGVLTNDGWSQIEGFNDVFVLGEDYSVLIEIEEVSGG